MDETYFTKIKKYYSYLKNFTKKNKINSQNYYNKDIKRTSSCSFGTTSSNMDKNNKFSKSDTDIIIK